MRIPRPETNTPPEPLQFPLFFIALRARLSARFGEPVLLERIDERGELWSVAGRLIAIDALTGDRVGIIMMDGARPDFRRVRMDDPGLRDALEHIMELSSHAITTPASQDRSQSRVRTS